MPWLTKRDEVLTLRSARSSSFTRSVSASSSASCASEDAQPPWGAKGAEQGGRRGAGLGGVGGSAAHLRSRSRQLLLRRPRLAQLRPRRRPHEPRRPMGHRARRVRGGGTALMVWPLSVTSRVISSTQLSAISWLCPASRPAQSRRPPPVHSSRRGRHAATRWPGLSLCDEACRERALWLSDSLTLGLSDCVAVCQAGGATVADHGAEGVGLALLGRGGHLEPRGEHRARLRPRGASARAQGGRGQRGSCAPALGRGRGAWTWLAASARGGAGRRTRCSSKGVATTLRISITAISDRSFPRALRATATVRTLGSASSGRPRQREQGRAG